MIKDYVMCAPAIKVTPHKDYKGETFYWWAVYTTDWTNSSVKMEGSADSLTELYEAIGKAVTKILPQSGSTYSLGRR